MSWSEFFFDLFWRGNAVGGWCRSCWAACILDTSATRITALMRTAIFRAGWRMC